MMRRTLRCSALAVLALALAGCASDFKRPDPTPLTPIDHPALQPKLLWSASVGTGAPNLVPVLAVDRLVVAASDGGVRALSIDAGKTLWSATVPGGISAGVGSDGRFSAVVNNANQVVSIGPNGQLLWNYQLPSAVLTPPGVFDGRVVVQSADQHLWAFNAANGRLLWSIDGRAPALLLQQGSGFVRVGEQLLVGDALGHIELVDLATGTVRGELPLAHAAGATEVERLISVTGAPALSGSVACARAYQAAVACVDLSAGRLRWSVKADGASAVSQDGSMLVAAQSDDLVQAYEVANGAVAWSQSALKYRTLSAPLLLDGTVAVGDGAGIVSLLAASDGHALARLETDGSPIQQQPLAVGHDLVVVTHAGSVRAWRLR